MQFTVSHPYLIFPTNRYATKKHLTFSENGISLYELDVKLDYVKPEFYAYIDLSRFHGKTLELSVVPEMELSLWEADTMELEDLYREPLRPQVHFTTKNGWINDPNGLICLDGIYHMFYQYNPCLNEWDNMHWGHATSTDLLHWEEMPTALFPDHTGMMYSGSAILDEKNLTGLGKDGKAPALIFYTATTPFAQYLAYSNDGFKTIQKYGDPVLPNSVTGGRDPMVIFCEEWDAYVMTLYLEGNNFGIFRSKDLLHWESVQTVAIPNDTECPNLFPLVADDGTRKWCLIGAQNHYLIGEMKEEGFVPVQEPRVLHYGLGAYAGQIVSGRKDGRTIRFDWDRSGIRTPRFFSQMSFPCDFTLIKEQGVYDLAANPIREIETLYETSEIHENVALPKDGSLRSSLGRLPYFVKLSGKHLDESAILSLNIFGRTLTFHVAENTMELGGEKFPLSIHGKGLDCQLIFDRISVEIYLDGGRIYVARLTYDTIPDENLPFLELRANTDARLDRIELHSLKSIWEA